MSKQIDFSKPLSEDDRKYLLDRGQDAAVRRIDAMREQRKAAPKQKEDQEPAADDSDGDESGKDWFGPNRPTDDAAETDWLEEWTVQQLKKQLDFYGVPYKSNASKGDLKDALYDYLEDDVV
jgi:hypothetical protein